MAIAAADMAGVVFALPFVGGLDAAGAAFAVHGGVSTPTTIIISIHPLSLSPTSRQGLNLTYLATTGLLCRQRPNRRLHPPHSKSDPIPWREFLLLSLSDGDGGGCGAR